MAGKGGLFNAMRRLLARVLPGLASNLRSGPPELTNRQVLAAEFAAIRPGVDFASSDDAELFRKVHEQKEGLSALCISGGGIRSATFALGVIQGLAKHGLLQRFDYLSTVSGGGFIGGWLTAWSKRSGGLDQVIPKLRPDAHAPGAGEVDPIGHLRDYSNYMTPKLGTLSADTWTLPATIVRNMLLNWLVFVPLLMATLLIPRIYQSAIMFPETENPELVRAVEIPSGSCKGQKFDYCDKSLNPISESPAVEYGLPVMTMVLIAISLFNTFRYLPGLGDRDHTRAQFVKGVLVPMVGAVFSYLAYDSLYYVGKNYTDESRIWPQLLGSMLPCLLALVVFLLFCKRPEGTSLRVFSLVCAVFVMAGGTGIAAWALTNFQLREMSWSVYVTLGPPAIVLGYVLGTVLFVGFSSNILRDEDREWMSRNMAAMLMFCGIWTALCGVVLQAPVWVTDSEGWLGSLLAVGGGIGAWLSAFGSAIMARQKSGQGPQQGVTGKGWTVAALAIQCAPVVFIIAVLVGLSVVTDLLLVVLHPLVGFEAISPESAASAEMSTHQWIIERTRLPMVSGLLLALLLFGGFAARFININTFSLHGMYRDRLVRAYLGASNPHRNANKYTGFARGDDFPIYTVDPTVKPFHVVNLTLNLATPSRLAWQQRKAQTFTVSPLHCGNYQLGYRPAKEYGGPRGITLGSALAISGAAASSNMGSYSSPLIAFIMTLLNARLGAWQGNPGPAGSETWRHADPRSAVNSLVQEALGLTSNESEYVYLSDGGHFENLGLYEMILRRCRYIVVLDSECDPEQSFKGLGNALRKVRIDFGITVSFDHNQIAKMSEHERRCAVGRINYAEVDGCSADGWLIYIKPMLRGGEPPDVDSYHRTHPDFPHEGTGDQWFNEDQTESYRMLGLHTIDEICTHGTNDSESLEDFCRRLECIVVAESQRGNPKPADQPSL